MTPSAILAAAALLLIPFAVAGLAMINSGLIRSRSAAHSLMASLCAVAVSAIAFTVLGYSLAGHRGGPVLAIGSGAAAFDWLGNEPLFLRGIQWDGSSASLTAAFGMLAAGLTALIPIAAAAERWTLRAACFSTALLAGIGYPLFAHWTWTGWLAQLGVQHQLGNGLVDSGGSGAIHAVGGLSALAISWILGPRRGKFGHGGAPMAIPGHNAVQVLSGCSLAWIGFLGLNSAGALLFSGAEPGRVMLVAVNCTLAAGSAGLTAALVARARFGKPDASLTANGWVGGLVAVSAGCALVKPAAAIVIGSLAGGVVTIAIEMLEARLGVDDPGGAISVHGLCGLWGLIAVGPFGPEGQWIAQMVGVSALLGFMLPLVYGVNLLLGRFVPHRVAPQGERQGMDLHELGAGAYPEFATHGEDFLLR